MATTQPTITSSTRGKLFVRPTWTTGIGSWLTTVDHKRLGILYMLTSFTFMAAAATEAFIMRLQLLTPNMSVVNPEQFNQLFTMHGVTMVFLSIMPLGIGIANYFVPLQIGARDLAFPRLNAFGYWVYLFGGLMIYSSWFLGGAPDMGWVAYAPLTSLSHNPGLNVDFYMFGLFISGVGTTATAMNLIVTMVNMRAPGMTMMRMPVFAWMMLITSFMIIFAFPPLTIAFLEIILDRTFGTLFFVQEAGALPILWQHLFWIFGHPEVYIIILPAFGVISEIIPTFSRKPIFGYPIMILSGILIGFMGFAVWTHHMFTTGLGPVVNTAFSLTSFIIGIPTGVKIFNWLGTLWGGSIRFTTSLLYALAFLVTFTLGGITGIMVAMPTFDAQVHDTYFVVAHFHYVMGGGALLAFFGALYYWFPKITGKMMDEKLGKVAWVFTVIGFHLIFFPQHLAGLMGMPRRIQTYPEGIGLELVNMLSTIGSWVMGVGLILIFYGVIHALVRGKPAGKDPWDARTLEWTTESPPAYYGFKTQPVVNSLDAFWAEKYPESMHVTPPDPAEGRAYDAAGVHIPGQSWFPILGALALAVGCYGLMYDNMVLAVICGLSFIFTIFAWAFEGVGGTHLHFDVAEEHV
ncbi:MAG: cytochrome c oxidase subunit I [Trueperaceae bacterium]|jgi:cytochrome c oxidase subunit 1|nr:cytochrome c oxidase subunit I [Truepera sp.]HRN17469.1 cytochrome c oxidase subunit I [Trueperaceae bacterium]HRQ09807.1 cytochrome c oxidase subunit I [Trueperaceae bacterium]